MRFAVTLCALLACAAPAIAGKLENSSDPRHEASASAAASRLESRNGLLVFSNVRVVASQTASALVHAPATMSVRADGVLSATLGPSQMSYLVAKRLDDGRLVQACSTGEPAALVAADAPSDSEVRHGR